MFVQEWELPAAAPKTVTPVQQALLQAADYIETHGWCQGNMQKHDGRVCLYGALKYGVPDALLGMLARDFLLGYLNIRSLMLWNDLKCENQEHAVAMLRAAAAAVR